jgi:hypothetical protein
MHKQNIKSINLNSFFDHMLSFVYKLLTKHNIKHIAKTKLMNDYFKHHLLMFLRFAAIWSVKHRIQTKHTTSAVRNDFTKYTY